MPRIVQVTHLLFLLCILEQVSGAVISSGQEARRGERCPSGAEILVQSVDLLEA